MTTENTTEAEIICSLSDCGIAASYRRAGFNAVIRHSLVLSRTQEILIFEEDLEAARDALRTPPVDGAQD